jgi:micrococcal nuclease
MYEYRVKYISNYDGDTIRFMVDLGFGIYYKLKVRVARINTPEIRSQDQISKEKAYRARDKVKELLESANEIVLKTDKDRKGKYGRYIAEVLFDGNNLSDLLLNEDLAEKY